MRIGFTSGVFDLFHVGHLNHLRNCRQHCDHLVVGVNTSAVVRSYKDQEPTIEFEDRCEILRSVRYVDRVVPRDVRDTLEDWRRHQFDVQFVGGDWKGTARAREIERTLAPLGVPVIYLPYTPGISSRGIRRAILAVGSRPAP